MLTKKAQSLIVPSAARASAGNGENCGLPLTFDDVILLADVTVAGTTITLNYQVSLDGGTTWATVDSFTAITATGQYVKRITAPIGSLCRISWSTVTGSFTFSVRADFSAQGMG